MGCDTADSTCNGGFMDDDFAFAEKNGPCTEASYSYPFRTRYASNAKDLAVRDVASRAVTISCHDQMECSSPFMRIFCTSHLSPYVDTWLIWCKHVLLQFFGAHL